MTDRATVPALAAVAALLAVAAVGAVGAASPLSLSCVDGDTGAVYTAGAGLQVSDDTASDALTANPFVDETTLAFGNATVRANGSARTVLETATADSLCVGETDATATPVTLVPDDFASVTLEGNVSALSYGPVSYDAGAADLRYDAAESVTLTLTGGPSAGTTVRAVDADSGATLANATADDSGRVTLSLPAGAHGVDLRTGAGGPDPSLSVSLDPASVAADESTPVAAVVTGADSGTPVANATVEVVTLGPSGTTNASGEATLIVAVDPGNYTVSAAAEGYREGTATLTVERTVPAGAVYEPGSMAAAYDGASGERDGRITVGELGEAAADYATHELTIDELGDVAAAYASS
jgi:hypothetical protein